MYIIIRLGIDLIVSSSRNFIISGEALTKVSILTAAILAVSAVLSGGKVSAADDTQLSQFRSTPPKPAVSKWAPPTMADVGDSNEVAVISTPKGEIVVEFYPKIAPMHVANFKKLAKAGFYDGTTFHRVVPGFVIQGGDPNSKDSDHSNDGMGGPGYSVKAEFSEVLHEKGILSMARSSDPNSAGSQFFICLGRTPHLDNKYTVFGKVIKGIDVVDAIGKQKRDPSNPQDRVSPAVVMKQVRITQRSTITGLDEKK